MSHLLPPASHPAREMFDVADLVAIGARQRDPITFRDAVFAARRFFDGADKAARRVCYIALRANGALELVSFGRRGGHKVEWRFSGPEVE